METFLSTGVASSQEKESKIEDLNNVNEKFITVNRTMFLYLSKISYDKI